MKNSKFLWLLLACLISMLICGSFVACGDDDDDDDNNAAADDDDATDDDDAADDDDDDSASISEIEVVSDLGDTMTADLTGLTAVDKEGEDAYNLQDVVEASGLEDADSARYTFEASDGFNPVDAGEELLDWDTLSGGFLTASGNLVWDEALELSDKWKVKDVAKIIAMMPDY